MAASHFHSEPTPTAAIPRPAQFVGREGELQVLRDALEDTLAGRGLVLLIAGEPGIGKTRIVEELIVDAKQQNVATHWAYCYEWEGAPPFWPWVQVIRSIMRECDSQEIRDHLGAGLADIAQIVSEVRELFPDLPPLPAMEPEQARFRLFEAVSTLLKYAANRRPTAIVLDDLHWADEPTLLLVQFMAQEIRQFPLLIMGTYREVDIGRRVQLTPILAEIFRERGSRQIGLAGLSKVDVSRFLAQALNAKPPESLVNAVYQETAGNPFFVTEVARLLISEGGLESDLQQATSWRIRIPESVRAVVGRRFDQLSPDCQKTLAAASVIGRTFTLTMLERGCGGARAAILEALDEACRAQLITPDDGVGRNRFNHALVQETIYQRLSTSRRAELHLTVAEAIEQLHADNLPPHFAELAHHFYQASPTGGLRKVIDYATLAGKAAVEQSGWEAAAGHFRRALDTIDVAERSDQPSRCELLLSLGEVQVRFGPGSGDAPLARESFLLAAEIARALDDPKRLARAAIGYAGFNIADTFGGMEQIGLLEEALGALPREDSPLRAQLLGRLAIDYPCRSQGDLERACELGNEAVAMATRLDDPALLVHALLGRYMACGRPDNLEARRADDILIATLAGKTNDLRAESLGHFMYQQDAVEDGDIASAEQAYELLLFGERSRITYVMQREAAYRASLDLLRGRYADAERRIEQARSLWQSDAISKYQAQRFALLRDLGRLDELHEGIHLPSHFSRSMNLARAYRLLWLLETGRRDEVRAIFESLTRDDFAGIPRDLSWITIMVLLAEAAVTMDDSRQASKLYDLLLPYNRRIAQATVGAICQGPVALSLGLLATTLQDWDTANAHIRQALDMSESMGLRPYFARALLAQAVTLIARNQPGDRRQALEALDRAEIVAREIGMAGLYDPIAAQRNEITGAASSDFGLTAREVDVLRLVAQGLTDAEVAEQLGISPRTVNTHVRSLFAKLDVPSRAAATRTAVEQHLI